MVMVFNRWKTFKITGFCGKLSSGALRRYRSGDRAADG